MADYLTCQVNSFVLSNSARETVSLTITDYIVQTFVRQLPATYF